VHVVPGTNGAEGGSGVQGAVPEEAEHREGRCAASGKAPDRGVPAAVRRGRATTPGWMQRPSNAGISREWPPGCRRPVERGGKCVERNRQRAGARSRV